MICFAWKGFPQYGARAVGAFVRSTKERVIVLATHPSVPVEGMEKYAECEVIWVKERVQVDVKALLGEVPRCMFSSAWWAPEFSKSWSVVRTNGGRVIAMIDNNYVPTLKCFLNGLRFRVCFARRFDGYFVPGNSSVRLLKSYGVAESKIAKGFYCADANLFRLGPPPSRRPKKILFTGRLIERKNVLRTCAAFIRANQKVGGGWTLDVCGVGPLVDRIPVVPEINIRGFVQPEEIAALYQEARAFVLPSLEEHWGLVVHEAALSGCMLLLSDRVGAADDFVTKENGALFNPHDKTAIEAAFLRVMTMSSEDADRAVTAAAVIAQNASLDLFVKGMHYFADMK